MKKIIFFLTFFFFIFSIQNVNARLGYWDSFHIAWKKCTFWTLYWLYNWKQSKWTLITCEGWFEKFYSDVFLNYLKIDFWNNDYYFIDDRDLKYYYLRKDFTIDIYSFQKDPNCNDANTHFLYNWIYRCDWRQRPWYSPLQHVNVHGNKTYYKSEYDRNTNSHNLTVYTRKVDSENEFTVKGAIPTWIAQIWPDSYSVLQKSENWKVDVISYNPVTWDSQINTTNIDFWPSNYDLKYHNNWEISVLSSSWNQKYSWFIDFKFTKSSPNRPNIYDWLEGKFWQEIWRAQIDWKWEFLQCKEFSSSAVPTCWFWEFLKLNWEKLTCEKWNPTNPKVNFTLSWKETFNYYESSFHHPSCAYLNKIKSNQDNPWNDSDSSDNNDNTETPPEKEEPPKEENEWIWWFFSWLGSKIAAWLKAITDFLWQLGTKISDWFESIKGLFTWDYWDVNLDSKWVDFWNVWKIKTDWDWFLKINQWNMQNLVKEWTKCKLFNESNYTFLYYSNWNFAINFSLKQYAILDNSFGGFLDFIAGLFIWPINNIMWIVRTFTPFTYDNQQVCLFWEIKTITFHKFMQGTETYWKMTIFDYIVLFTFSWFIFFLIWWTSFFRWVSTPEWQVQNFKYTPYSKWWYIVNDKIK